MSTEIENVVRDDRWNESPIALTQFGGASRGLMVQVTMRNTDGRTGFVQLTKGEAVRLANRLTEWANGHAVMGDGCNEQ